MMRTLQLWEGIFYPESPESVEANKKVLKEAFLVCADVFS